MTDASSKPNVPNFRAASDADIEWISRALTPLLGVASHITRSLMTRAPSDTSIGWKWFRAMQSTRASQWITEATNVIEFANITAFDHIRAFLSLLEHDDIHATSLATVTRGAVEALGRSRYLLDAFDEEDLARRTMSLLFDDLTYPAKFGDDMRTRDGDASDPNDRRESYKAELSRLSLPGPAKIEQTSLVASVLDAELGGGQLGRAYYSQLSGIAHGHRLAVNNFVTSDEDRFLTGLIARQELVAMFALFQYAAIAAVMRPLVIFYGRPRPFMSALTQALMEAELNLSRVKMPTL